MTATPPEPNPDPFDRVFRLLSRFERFFRDIGGVFLLALSLMSLLALLAPELAGGLLDWWVRSLQNWFGWGTIWPVVGIGLIGLRLLRRGFENKAIKTHWGQVLAIEIAAFASLVLLSACGGLSLLRADQGMDGGRIGWGLARLLGYGFEAVALPASVMVGLFASIIIIISLLYGLGISGRILAVIRRPALAMSAAQAGMIEPVVTEAPLQSQNNPTIPTPVKPKKRFSLPEEFRKNLHLTEDEDQNASPPRPRPENLPPYDLLSAEQVYRPDERTVNQMGGIIEKTLAEFGIPAKVVNCRVGPTVTQFAVEPGFIEKEKGNGDAEAIRQKVRVAKISALSRDLALALSAERLRIEAPVPGRPYIGIEVPNARASVVRLRPLLESEPFHKLVSPLAIALGRDVSGQPVIADLERMPHLLIAGTTGSGKSVCIAALTACLVMNNTPDELRLVMIDPKMVELVRFNGLPHLLGKVETETERVLAVLRWTVAEMDRRYKLLEASRSRNLDTYNRKARRKISIEPLPRIVVLIDELADLMLSAPDQTEHNLVRLAQMARATGIHLVVATQRPGTEVVTGLIKANFPARISFMVASSIDSRVILDVGGAETLLGRGDMLFVPPDASAPIRAQGVMVSDQEVERLITYWQKVTPPLKKVAPSPWEAMIVEGEMAVDRDNLIEQAIEIVKETRRASASLLQRRLRIGFPRAARLIDELEEMGVVSAAHGGSREREVLLPREDGGL